MKGLFSVVVLIVGLLFASLTQSCSAQCVDCGPVVVQSPVYYYYPTVYETGINWNQDCAIQSAQLFQQCRASGGNRWACLAQAGLNYWTCSGSTFETAASRGRLRAVVAGSRAVRRGR